MYDLDTGTMDDASAAPLPSGVNGRPAVRRHERPAPNRPRWPWLVAGLAVGAVATLVVAAWEGDGGTTAVPVVESVDLGTVQVVRQDLVEEVEWAGTLSSGLAVDISASADGVVTWAPEVGSALDRGDVAVDIDDQPVVVLFGDIPMWRELGVGDEGPDVRQLEANLVRLGYDPDGEVTVDDEFTSATGDLVERWEQDLGLEESGSVPIERVVVLPGPTEVADTPTIGAVTERGAALMSVDAASSQIDVVGGGLDADADGVGEIGFLAPTGTPIEHGTVLYTADGVDVIAVVDLDETGEAVLDAMSSNDVDLLESVLVDKGFDPEGLVSIDDEIDLQTAAAVQRWQTSVGLPTTGSAEASDYVVVPEAADAPYAVGDVYLQIGDVLGEGAVVMSVETPTLAVTADIAVGEIDEFAVGDAVTIEQLDESRFEAVVASIAEVANPAEGQDASPTITVTFDVISEPDDFVSGAVTVITESSRVDDATVVPSRALLTLREGGHAVEKVLADGTTTLVGVEIGTFDDGMVEIVSVTAGDLAVGDDVVVPS